MIDKKNERKDDVVEKSVTEQLTSLKVEIESPVESFLSLAVIFHGIFSFLVCGGMYLALSRFLPESAMRGFYYMIAVHGGTFLLLLFLRFGTRCFYDFDGKSQCIDFVCRIPGYSYRSRFLEFAQIELVSATGLRNRTTSPPIDKWYTYTVCLLDKQGNIYELAREGRDLEQMNALATTVSQASGCEMLNCLKENVIKAEIERGLVRVELVHLPIKEFTGTLLPFEEKKQLVNFPVILGAFFASLALVIIGTVFLTVVFTRL